MKKTYILKRCLKLLIIYVAIIICASLLLISVPSKGIKPLSLKELEDIMPLLLIVGFLGIVRYIIFFYKKKNKNNTTEKEQNN
jgi:predicted neutral ceramidase superfamily lipid hydrolase